MGVTGDATVAYLGWHGLGNLGDDAIYDAVRGQLRGATFLDLPRLPHQLIYATVTAAMGLNRSLRRSSQVVGGGTLVGRSQWRLLVNRGLALTKDNASYAIGVGVEDPAFGGRNSGSGRGELTRWAPILSKFRTVSVRGPRSAELLSDIGLDVEVSGDPALLLPRPAVTPEDGVIGVNLGFGDDLWGHDPTQLADEIAGAVKQLSSHGYRFVGILMNPEDRRWTEMALGDIPEAEMVLPANPDAAARELARCSVAIVTRLHASVLASLSDTPVVSLEYQPKCRDFALAIDDERSLVRTDEVSSGAVVDRVFDAIGNASSIRSRKHTAVARLKRRLDGEYADLARELGLAS
ncbi:polysaccharide pyruvyl transferase family protein [Mycobacterium sp. WUMAC-067]|uniref:polysaccharide pyruvyl transferase family protein n=1 Tax=unclassified Mycobacterium TaxID=2642494 RepID=UPI001CD94B82|nr:MULTISPECIES: polysaccharide pyruvyl transferase family protein [unclassified Mycobacterium]MCA2243317.1 polysaccharide pyruvyl transferase family protein [Mycobacterium sp. WUMAC-067]MCA2314307.1 polysaccharide pyruvyl transferase family protein [Mycobacterium sp. WUMAC-025]